MVIDSSAPVRPAASQVSRVGVGIPNLVGQASGASWTYVFTTSPSGGLTGGSSTITLSAPAGTVLPLTASDYAVGGVGVSVALQSAPNNVTITVPSGVNPGFLSSVSVTASNVTNPPAATYTCKEFSAKTSVDTNAASPLQSIVFKASASSGAVVKPTVAVSTIAGGATGVTWSARFTTSSSGAMGPTSSVTMAAPAGTQFSSACCNFLIDVTSGQVAVFAGTTLSNGGATATVISNNFAVASGDQLVVVLFNVTNPVAGTSLDGVTVSTTSDQTPVAISGGRTLVANGKVSKVSVATSTTAGGATGVTWSVRFTASANGSMTPGTQVTITAPAGTQFSSACCNFLTDVTTGEVQVFAGTSLSNGNATVTLASGSFPVAAGDQFVAVLFGVTNPPTGTSLDSVTVSTDSDYSPASPTAAPSMVANGKVSNPTVQVSSLQGSATGVTWSARFAASPTGTTAPGAQATVAAPAGTQFSTACCNVLANLTTGEVNIFPGTSVSNGNATVTISSGGFPVAVGDQILAVFFGVTNPAAGTSLNSVAVSTPSDYTPANPVGEPSFT